MDGIEEIIKVKAEIHAIETNKQKIQRINEIKTGSLKN
jgi:hypothetical protein